jgi:hypothetical protein
MENTVIQLVEMKVIRLQHPVAVMKRVQVQQSSVTAVIREIHFVLVKIIIQVIHPVWVKVVILVNHLAQAVAPPKPQRFAMIVLLKGFPL